MRVLIIDDNADQRAALALLLRAVGHDVALADDGDTGLALATRTQPDVVFLDYQMPSMTGYQVARRLRRQHAAGTPRIVLMTGSTRVTADDARVAGCDALVRKPATSSVMLAALYGARTSAVLELSAPTATALAGSPALDQLGSPAREMVQHDRG